MAAAALAAGLIALAAHAHAAGLPDFSVLAEKDGPAVVNISTEATIKGMRGQIPGMPPGGGPYDDFFHQFDEFFGRGMTAPRKEHSLGSGFLISSDGEILTNNHVVAGADKILVKLQGKAKNYPAKVLGQDPDTDLALIKIDEKNLPFLKIGDSSKSRVGDWVLAIGNPFGLDHTVTKGIISAKGRVIGAGPYDDFIQTDASINPGNSGGPLINMDGDVIGINAAIVASGQGIGFAIPSDLAKDVVAQLRQGKKMHRGLLGVAVQDVDDNTAKALGLKDNKGALVAQVTPGGPAEKAGVQAGDVITQVGDQDVADSRDLTMRIGHMAPKDTVRLTLVRGGAVKKLSATLEERDAKTLAQAESGGAGDSEGEGLLGMGLKTVNPKESKALGVPAGKGLLVTGVEQDSPAADAGVRRGDVILEMNQIPVKSVEEARKIVSSDGKQRGAVMLLITRQGQQTIRTIAVN
ncbi:MAG: Do family serine endopeptidase [Desulfovibrionaceae bacterium]|nr:Do family serine endopeptidase [Desulfovibrionaceae bacterium]MBF0515054.1 Do family serine endopeptidase [Desulfovibrionaceae bacterium]